MRALLVDVDSREDVNNNAIGKYLTHYKQLGWEVDIMKLKLPGYPHSRKHTTIDASSYDTVRASIIFKRNRNMISIENCSDVIIGGTGYNISLKLPPEIDDLEATLYGGSKERIEFITRGCIRDCYFCLVQEKEGPLHEYRTIERILSSYHGERIRFFDNNFLAWEGANETLNTLIKRKVPVSFNEGLDIRMVTEENALLLSRLNNYRPDYTFAFDDYALLPTVIRKTKILKRHFGRWRLKFYILTDANKPTNEAVARILWCKAHEILPYTMRYENCYESNNKNFYTDLAAWTNQAGHFKKTTFEQFLKVRQPSNQERRETSLTTFNRDYIEPEIIEFARVQKTLEVFT